jgi:mRNA interferase MazF
MPTFRQGQIVRVPFPYTDRNTRQHRPALVISNGAIGDGQSLIWVAMITSAENRRWLGDHAIVDFVGAGLPIPSVVRIAKITTVEAHDAEPVGQLDGVLTAEVIASIIGVLSV